MELSRSEKLVTFENVECTILIIDDEPANLNLMVDTMASCGFKTAVALTGKKGLDIARRDQPDLILLDIKLPDIQGYEICQQLKDDPDTKDIPVIFLTVSTSTQDRLKGFEVGAVDYIVKPFHHQEALARITTHLKIKVLTEHLEQTVRNRTTELINTNRRLKQSEERYALAQRAGNIGSWDWDIINNHLSWSETIEPMFGFSKGEFNKSFEAFRECVHPEDRRKVQEAITASIEEYLEYTIEHRIIWPDGTVRWVSASGNVFRDEQGEPVRMLGIVQDITTRKKTEEELHNHRKYLEDLVRERTAEISEAKVQAEAANRAKSEFLARMSHEIRTPISVVMGLTGIVLKSELKNDQRNNLNKVQLACNNLLTIINDILDFSKVEAGKLDLVTVDFDLDQLMEQLADMFSNRLQQKDLELILAVDPHIPNNLKGDPGRLSQVLTNLIENAVKFTDQGEIVIGAARADNAEVKSGQVALKFWIQDSGIGIDANILPTLFEPFTQADSTLTRAQEGSGLGLSICRRLVELMGGEIGAKSTPGQGSTLYFTVLLHLAEEEKTRFTTPEDLYDLKTLVVDDSPSARQAIAEQLESFRFEVSTVESGQQALNALRQAGKNHPYQLVLMDWRMPGMDGLETARIIRDMPESQGLPIIILVTAFGHELVQKKIETSPADTLLLKPVKPSLLFNTIMELYNKSENLIPFGIDQHPVDQRLQLKGRRVLVVEDSVLNRDVAVAVLEWKGMEVEIAENGLIAFEKVTKAPKDYYDAVLMDIQMPVMDGYTASQEIRKSKTENRHVPIIALTAHALSGEREKCLAAGLNDYVAKPIDEKYLEKVLLKWITLHHQKTVGMTPLTTGKPTHHRKGLDMEGALKRFGGKEEIFHLILEKFAAENEQTFEKLAYYLETDRRQHALEISHTLKGSAGVIGAVTLGKLARDIEPAIHSNSPEIDDLLKNLKHELDCTLDEIRNLLLTRNV